VCCPCAIQRIPFADFEKDPLCFLQGVCSGCCVGCRALHHRESSGPTWGAWLMNLSQDWPGGSKKHLQWSSAALCSSEPPAWSPVRTFWRFPEQKASDDGMRDGPGTRQHGRCREQRGRIAVKRNTHCHCAREEHRNTHGGGRRQARVAEHPPTLRRDSAHRILRPRTASRPNS
jgi:hypothetical protein